MATYGTQNRLSDVHLLDRRQGYDRRGRPGHSTVPDDVVLGMRRLHEIDRKPHSVIWEHYPEYSKQYIRSVLDYTIRAHLVVKK